MAKASRHICPTQCQIGKELKIIRALCDNLIIYKHANYSVVFCF